MEKLLTEGELQQLDFQFRRAQDQLYVAALQKTPTVELERAAIAYARARDKLNKALESPVDDIGRTP